MVPAYFFSDSLLTTRLKPKSIVFVVLIVRYYHPPPYLALLTPGKPVLVLLSGVFAGLTLGYMSLDQTQLNVLCLSGTPYVSPRPYYLAPYTTQGAAQIRQANLAHPSEWPFTSRYSPPGQHDCE